MIPRGSHRPKLNPDTLVKRNRVAFNILFQQLFNNGHARFTGNFMRGILGISEYVPAEDVAAAVKRGVVDDRGWLVPVELDFDNSTDVYTLTLGTNRK
jgi:hypothetical protein